MDIIKYAVIKIQEQQKKYSEDSKEHCIAQQIIDIVEEDEHNAELVGEDFSDKTLEEIESKIHKYANKHGGCTPPKAADKIIREHFGLSSPEKAKKKPKIFDIGDLLG